MHFRFAIPIHLGDSKNDVVSGFLEVNSIDFWPEKKSDFIVAASNNVIHCSSESVANGNVSSDYYKNPKIMNYKSHSGIATCVSCFPQTDLFASSGSDWTIHISSAKIVNKTLLKNN